MGEDTAASAMAVSATVEINLQWPCDPRGTCSRFGVLGDSDWSTLDHVVLSVRQTDEGDDSP